MIQDFPIRPRGRSRHGLPGKEGVAQILSSHVYVCVLWPHNGYTDEDNPNEASFPTGACPGSPGFPVKNACFGGGGHAPPAALGCGLGQWRCSDLSLTPS